MFNFGTLFTDYLTSFALITLFFVNSPVVVSILFFKRKSKELTPSKFSEDIDKQHSAEQQTGKDAEAKPAEPKKSASFASLGELVSAIGAKQLMFFNQFGIPIESYNFNEELRVSALLAEVVFTMRKFSPNFSSTVFEDGQKIILLSIGKIGEVEVFALTMSSSEATLKMEEMRELLRTYLLESLGKSA